MSELYDKISTLIKEITYLDKCSRVAIIPFNEAGMIAKTIFESCYGYTPIIVDDELVKYNNNIISVEQYKQISDSNDVVIVCILDPTHNQECVKKLRQAGVKAKVKNILSLPIAYHPEKGEYFKELKKLLLVQEAVGFELKRYGRHHDGGYVMLDDFVECHYAYSFGINDDSSWDEQIAENDIDVFCYDHTIDSLPNNNPRLHFNKIGIGVRDSLGESLLSFDTILDFNKCQNEDNMILKMDTEGAEWGVIRDISSETLSKFSQMTFEFHNVASTYFLSFEETLAIFEKLNRTHQVIWIHANNFGAVEQSGNIVIPDTIEITYANRNKYQFQPCEYKCPLNIDEPNHSVRPDVELDNFGAYNSNDIIEKNSLKFFENDECKDISAEINEFKNNAQDSIIEAQTAKLNEQDSIIEAQTAELNEQVSIIENQNARLSEQQSVIDNQMSEIRTRDNRINMLLRESEEKSDVISSLQHQLEQTKNEINLLYHSRSWRMTAPMRKIFALFRKLFKGDK